MIRCRKALSSAGYEEDELLYVNLYPGEDRLAETSAGGRPGVNQWGYTALYAKEALATTYGVFLVGDRMVPTPEPGGLPPGSTFYS